MRLSNITYIGAIGFLVLPALLAASTESTEFDPALLLDVARAFSSHTADSQDTYVELSVTKSIIYSTRVLIEGHRENTPITPDNQSLTAIINGRLETGHTLSGQLLQSDGPVRADRMALSLASETETLAVGDISYSVPDALLPHASHKSGVRFAKGTSSWGVDGIASMPQVEMRTEYFPGKGTQGPFTLADTPVARGTEEISVISGVIERRMPTGSYQLNHDTGTIVFVDQLIHENQLLKVRYQGLGSVNRRSIRRISTRCQPADSIRATAQILSIPRTESAGSETYTAWGLDSRVRGSLISARVSLEHPAASKGQLAGSELGLTTVSDKLRMKARYLDLRESLARHQGMESSQREIEAGGVVALPYQSCVLLNYSGRRGEKGQGERLEYGLSVLLPFSTTLSYARSHETQPGCSANRNTLSVSGDSKSYEVTVSLFTERSDRGEMAGCSSFVLLKPFDRMQVAVGSNHMFLAGTPERSSFLLRMSGESNALGTSTLSLQLDRSRGSCVKRIAHAEASTRGDLPVELSGKYDLRYLSSEGDAPHGAGQVHDLSGSAEIRLAGFAATYSPSLSYSRGTDHMKHSLLSSWAIVDWLAIEATAERVKYDPPEGNGTPHSRENFRTALRVSPIRSLSATFEYYTRMRRYDPIPLVSIEHGWHARALFSVREGAILELGFSDFGTARNKKHSTVPLDRDRRVEARASKELSPELVAYVKVGVTRRDALVTGYSRSPGVGLQLRTGRGVAAEVSYTATMWEGLPERDSENAALEVNAAANWISSTCRVEYISLTRPVSKTVELSVETSLHF